MLPDRLIQLLTAHVDGELSSRQRRAVQRLLHRSAEARQLWRQLQQDAESLGRLPRHRPERDLTAQVMLTIATRKLQPRRSLPMRSPARPIPLWMGTGLAASVLFLVGLGSYLYFSTVTEPSGIGPVAQHTPAPPHEEVPPHPVTVPSGTPKSETRPETSRPVTPQPPVQVAERPKDVEKPEPPRTPSSSSDSETALTQPIDPKMEMFQPRSADVALPMILHLGELDSGGLQEELKKDSGFRLEVPCRDSSKACERLQAAFKANGINVVIEPAAQARLKQHRLPTNFVLYAEDLLPEELSKILQHLGSEDRKAEAKHRGDGEFDAAVLARMSKDDHKELSQLLGVDSRQPEAGKTSSRQAEHLALVLAYNPVRARPDSPEVKRFLENRKAPRAGTLQVLLVLRQTKA